MLVNELQMQTVAFRVMLLQPQAVITKYFLTFIFIQNKKINQLKVERNNKTNTN